MGTSWKSAFQEKMKLSGMTYNELARQLGMSISGAKKIFQKNDISLERFSNICRLLEIDPTDLVGKLGGTGSKVNFLPPAAEDFFAENDISFDLYWLLSVERLDV